MKKFLQGPVMAILLGGLSFLLTMGFLLKEGLAARQMEAEQAAEPVFTGFWDQNNPEVDLLVAELRKEKEGLKKREDLLKDLEIRLGAERAEINAITQRVHQMQLEFDQHIVRVKEEEAANLKKLARLYATMTPEGAALILKEMEDSSVVKILMHMKETESAPLLEGIAMMGEMQARRAAGISEQLRRAIPDKPRKGQ